MSSLSEMTWSWTTSHRGGDWKLSYWPIGLIRRRKPGKLTRDIRLKIRIGLLPTTKRLEARRIFYVDPADRSLGGIGLNTTTASDGRNTEIL